MKRFVHAMLKLPNPLTGSLEVPSLEVVDEVREVVARFLGLLGREIAPLGRRQSGQGSEGVFLASVRHAQTFRLFEGLCSIGSGVKGLESATDSNGSFGSLVLRNRCPRTSPIELPVSRQQATSKGPPSCLGRPSVVGLSESRLRTGNCTGHVQSGQTVPHRYKSIADSLRSCRVSLGMSCALVAARSGLTVPTVKRILGGQADTASFASVVAIAEALGASLRIDEIDIEELCRQQARHKADKIARLVQGTSALAGRAVDAAAYNRLVERSFHDLLTGSMRRLWSL